MKSKVLSFICVIAIICVSVLPISAVAPKVGEEIGNVLNTDIKTYINGQRIPSYNINNKSAIFIKDLANYGFDTVFSQQNRTTTISYNQNKKLTPLKDFDETTGKVGTVAFRYVYTDIVAVINGRRVECFNVKGYNAIYFSELSDFGTFTWENSTRESRFTLTEKTDAPSPSTPTESPKVGEEIGNILNTDIKTYINGQRIPSYNINNKSAVFIKDLANYGFDTVFNEKNRTTTISYNPNKKATPLKNFDETTGKVGTIAFRYVYTDIVAVINGRRIECFNVKGYNAIYFSELSDFGTFTWDNAERESRFIFNNTTIPVTQDDSSQSWLSNIYGVWEWNSSNRYVLQLMEDGKYISISFYKTYDNTDDFLRRENGVEYVSKIKTGTYSWNENSYSRWIVLTNTEYYDYVYSTGTTSLPRISKLTIDEKINLSKVDDKWVVSSAKKIDDRLTIFIEDHRLLRDYDLVPTLPANIKVVLSKTSSDNNNTTPTDDKNKDINNNSKVDKAQIDAERKIIDTSLDALIQLNNILLDDKIMIPIRDYLLAGGSNRNFINTLMESNADFFDSFIDIVLKVNSENRNGNLYKNSTQLYQDYLDAEKNLLNNFKKAVSTFRNSKSTEISTIYKEYIDNIDSAYEPFHAEMQRITDEYKLLINK